MTATSSIASLFLCLCVMPPAVLADVVSSSSSVLISTTPSSFPTPPRVGRARSFSLQGDITSTDDERTLGLIVIQASGKDRLLKGSAIAVDAGNAQIVKRGKSRLEVNALVVGDRVSITGKVMPDGVYLAQHVRVIAKPKPRAVKSKKK